MTTDCIVNGRPAFGFAGTTSHGHHDHHDRSQSRGLTGHGGHGEQPMYCRHVSVGFREFGHTFSSSPCASAPALLRSRDCYDRKVLWANPRVSVGTDNEIQAGRLTSQAVLPHTGSNSENHDQDSERNVIARCPSTGSLDRPPLGQGGSTPLALESRHGEDLGAASDGALRRHRIRSRRSWPNGTRTRTKTRTGLSLHHH